MVARSIGSDLVTGDGLDVALAGVDAVIDTTNVASSGKRRSSEFFEAMARTLMRTTAAAGVRHIVVLSIIGLDRVPYGYYQGKLRQEEVLRESPAPVSILRRRSSMSSPGSTWPRCQGQWYSSLAGVPSRSPPARSARPWSGSRLAIRWPCPSSRARGRR